MGSFEVKSAIEHSQVWGKKTSEDLLCPRFAQMKKTQVVCSGGLKTCMKNLCLAGRKWRLFKPQHSVKPPPPTVVISLLSQSEILKASDFRDDSLTCHYHPGCCLLNILLSSCCCKRVLCALLHKSSSARYMPAAF